MSRIREQFEKQKKEGACGLLPFLTAGYPSMLQTSQYISALDRAGSCVIEIGVPFSDPIADGPVIQEANRYCCESGVTLEDVFGMIEEIREDIEAALVLLIYANTIEHYGVEAFYKRCKGVGVDGVIVPDIPIEELPTYEAIANDYNVDSIRLVAPTSHERIASIVKGAKGFIYCVSSMGTTGVRDEMHKDLEKMLETVKAYAKIPTAIGFGIHSAEQIKQLKKMTDGMIVGSAFVTLIKQYDEKVEEKIYNFAKTLRDACK